MYGSYALSSQLETMKLYYLFGPAPEDEAAPMA